METKEDIKNAEEREAMKKRVKKERLESEERKAKEKEKPTPAEIKKKEKEEFEESIQDLKKNIPKIYTEEQIMEDIVKNPEECRIFFEIGKNEPVMIKMIKDNLDLPGDPKQVTDWLRYLLKKWKLREVVEETIYHKIYIKDYCNKNLRENLKEKFKFTEMEKKMLKKISYSETMNERTGNRTVAVSGFWCLSDLGKRLLPKIKKEVTG